MVTDLHKGMKNAESNKYVGKCQNNNLGLILFYISGVVKIT